MATPIATVCAVAAAAQAQVVVKTGGLALDRLAALDVVALDKTGTLTEGALDRGAPASSGGQTRKLGKGGLWRICGFKFSGQCRLGAPHFHFAKSCSNLPNAKAPVGRWNCETFE